MSRRIELKHLLVGIGLFVGGWLIQLAILNAGVYLGGFVLQKNLGESSVIAFLLTYFSLPAGTILPGIMIVFSAKYLAVHVTRIAVLLQWVQPAFIIAVILICMMGSSMLLQISILAVSGYLPILLFRIQRSKEALVSSPPSQG